MIFVIMMIQKLIKFRINVCSIFNVNLDSPYLNGLANIVEEFMLSNKQNKNTIFQNNDKYFSQNSLNNSKMNINTHSTIVYN